MPRPGFFFCVCPDSKLIHEHIGSLLKKHPPESGGEYERRVYWGDEGLPDKFWSDLTMQSLIPAPKAIVVRNAQNLKAAHWTTLAKALNRLYPNAWPFFCFEVEFNRGKPKLPQGFSNRKFWKFAKKQKWVFESQGLTSKMAQDYVHTWAKSNGVTFAPGVLNTMVDALPLDARAIDLELGKILLALGPDKQVQAQHASLLTFSAELDIFEFIKALQKGGGSAQVWKEILAQQIGGGTFLFLFLSLLVREARILWQLYFREPVKLPQFIIGEKQRLASQLGPERLPRIWELALEAEWGVKSGERTEGQALELLISGLAELFGGAGAPARRGGRGAGNRPPWA